MEEYKNIWESFVQGMDFNHKLIKKDILNSWRRCKINNVSLYDFDGNILMQPKEKNRYVLKYLPEYKEAPYKEFCNIVENLELNISIYDKKAKLKYIVNYDDIYDDLYPQIGYFVDASEEVIGTNSTCLAILENKPFMVIGPDHYKYIFHQFSCVAAPFYNEDNSIAGTVNASFVHTSVNNDTLNVVYSLARLYESLILKREVATKSQEQQKDNKVKDQKERYFTFKDILGQSECIYQTIKTSKRAAAVDASVLIYGESGSGKEVFAQAIHSESKRNRQHFVAINCGAIPRDLIESELFGYEIGSFTGAAKKGKEGLLEYASGGTLFLDEVESMPLSVQVKILRALSSASITRVGGLKPISIDIRLIAASKKDLEEEIKKGNFREDLYYRINVIQLNIPPLRDRREDIKPILDYYIKAFSYKNQININAVEEEYVQYLESYNWPGNVRELLNIIERSLVLSENGLIDKKVLPPIIKESYTIAKLKKDFNQVFDKPLPKDKTLLEIAEEVILERVLLEEGNNLTNTAKRLGISRPTLYKKIRNSNRLNCK
ncbi:sigma-54 interaction domain-containing protein [Alkaliphilus peptidifermentans]|uniref:DNA-binding transcriptional response regulator, NtrC family, contains REC, AAA-type ATPase, and a Fis-type DNA-binding domains n=1 Tax=Alkaliphilus peptidifermentans DSM 18978 TaxID=1120976 RepID=A0A1G5L0Y4_9FIRM|nr:sigma-54 dependent transcriptional regulator [Alkaliphilus peptidifermentans]SCZ06008.1 DNA-binding transcriptional response regulator, NtrC family, contains REC, AAA-type ATPase, and a Fis-type DNA-binding domains [Alkaliphilus peptidifermentans DSM 18978]